MSELRLTRRALIQKTALASGGLALGFHLGDAADALAAGPFEPSAWLRIEPTGALVFVLDKAEMGQGVHTSLPTILAEELGVSPDAFIIENAPFGPAYANPALIGMQATGGSTSVATSFDPLRRAGATARTMLVAAAAKDWKVPASECHTPGDATVRHAASKRQRSYAELAALAAQEPVPDDVPLKDPKSFVHIGKSRPRLDGQAKVKGSAGFGIDVELPDLRCASLILCPVLGGKPTSFDATKAKAMPGVEDVVMTSRGVAIVAKKYWQARAAAAAVTVTWDEGPLAKVSTEGVFADFAKAANTRIEKVSDGSAARGLLSRTKGVLRAEYHVPYLAHAPMEPINCTARVTEKTCEVWAPTQHVSQARQVAHEASGVPLDQVDIHTTFLGGGFGRRLYQDYVRDVVEIAAAVKKPVKMIWSREDDIRHDYYRPGSIHALRAALDDKGMPLVWGQAIAGQSILAQTLPEWLRSLLPGWVPGGMKSAMGSLTGGLVGATGQDDTSVEGAKDLPYNVGTLLVEYDFVDPAIPVGFWRSVGHSYNGFVVESFVDELAHAAKQDPLQYRRALLKDKPRHLAALDLVASKAGWTETPRAGVFRGIAVHQSFGSVCAQVVELSIENGKTIKLHRIVAAIDCGRAVNPDHVVAQVTSGIVYGLSGALLGDVRIKDGKVEQSNFHDYPVLRMTETPPIEVHIVASEAAPSGVGEPGLPPVAAATANAIFAATGQRLRKLPLTLG